MARLLVAVAIVGILILGAMAVMSGLRAMAIEADRSKKFDMAEGGMLPKLSYGLLLALIVYATFTAGGG